MIIVEYFTGEVLESKVQESGYYTVFDGEKEHNVIAVPGDDEVGTWVSLGIFDFTKNAKVTLSDRKSDEKNSGYHHG